MQDNFRQVHSSVSDIEEFNLMARSLERSEIRRTSKKLEYARKDIADALGITASAIEGFRSLRTKIVPSWLKDRIREVLNSALQLEMQNLEHEIQLHKQAGANYSGNALVAAEAQLLEARETLRGRLAAGGARPIKRQPAPLRTVRT